jgi:hypothetical protein
MRDTELKEEEEEEMWRSSQEEGRRTCDTWAKVQETKQKVSHIFQLHSVIDHCRVMGSSMSCCHVFYLEIMWLCCTLYYVVFDGLSHVWTMSCIPFRDYVILLYYVVTYDRLCHSWIMSCTMDYCMFHVNYFSWMPCMMDDVMVMFLFFSQKCIVHVVKGIHGAYF